MATAPTPTKPAAPSTAKPTTEADKPAERVTSDKVASEDFKLDRTNAEVKRIDDAIKERDAKVEGKKAFDPDKPITKDNLPDPVAREGSTHGTVPASATNPTLAMNDPPKGTQLHGQGAPPPDQPKSDKDKDDDED